MCSYRSAYTTRYSRQRPNRRRTMMRISQEGPDRGSSAREDIMGRLKGRRPAPSLDHAAGNGLINRRALLGQGFAIAGVGSAATVTGAAAEPSKDFPGR